MSPPAVLKGLIRRADAAVELREDAVICRTVTRPAHTLSRRESAAAAASGDPGAAATLARYYDRLGRALASLINVLDPDVVVLGGGMSNIAGLPEATSVLLPRYLLASGASSDPIATRRIGRNRRRGASILP